MQVSQGDGNSSLSLWAQGLRGSVASGSVCAQSVLFSDSSLRFYDALDKSVRRDDWTDAEDQTINDLLASGTTMDLPKLAKDLNRPLEKVSLSLVRIAI